MLINKKEEHGMETQWCRIRIAVRGPDMLPCCSSM